MVNTFTCAIRWLLLASSLLLVACDQSPAQIKVNEGERAATLSTVQANLNVAKQLNLDDPQDFIEAKRGLIATDEHLKIPSLADPDIDVWNMPAYEFVQGNAPNSVNPSLWRQTKLNNIHGLFEVTPGIYQLRGFDLSNMTFIKGDSGWIVVDTMTSKETARYTFDFAMQHLAERYPGFDKAWRRCFPAVTTTAL